MRKLLILTFFISFFFNSLSYGENIDLEEAKKFAESHLDLLKNKDYANAAKNHTLVDMPENPSEDEAFFINMSTMYRIFNEELGDLISYQFKKTNSIQPPVTSLFYEVKHQKATGTAELQLIEDKGALKIVRYDINNINDLSIAFKMMGRLIEELKGTDE